MPVDLGIPVFSGYILQYAAFPLLESLAVRAIGNLLHIFFSFTPLGRTACAGVKKDFRISGKPQLPLLIDDSAPRIHGPVLIRQKSRLLLLPMEQIPAYRMPPAHILPSGVTGIILEKHMVNTVMIHQSVRIIEPPYIGGKMNQRPPLRHIRHFLRKGNGL